MSDIKIPYGSGEKEWEYPDLEIEMAERKSVRRVEQLNELFDPDHPRDPSGGDPVNRIVDERNFGRYDPVSGFKYGIAPVNRSLFRSHLEMWKKAFLNIDKLPGIPTWRIAKNGRDNCYIVRVGSTADIQLRKQEEKDEK